MVIGFKEAYLGITDRLINNVIINSDDGRSCNFIAQWDTGATKTCISHRVRNILRLPPIGMTKAQTPSGSMVSTLHKIDIILNREIYIPNLIAMDTDIGRQGIDVLIGMDIIGLGEMFITNKNNRTEFSFTIL